MSLVQSKQWQLCGLSHVLAFTPPAPLPAPEASSEGFSCLNWGFCSEWEQRGEAGVGVNHNSWFINARERNLIVKEKFQLLWITQISMFKSTSPGCISLCKRQSSWQPNFFNHVWVYPWPVDTHMLFSQLGLGILLKMLKTKLPMSLSWQEQLLCSQTLPSATQSVYFICLF